MTNVSCSLAARTLRTRIASLAGVLHLAGALVAAALFVLAAASPASAHSALLGTTPDDGAVVEARPQVIDMNFNEAVTLISLKMFDGTGAPVAILSKLSSGTKISGEAPENLAPGDYLVSYRVTSADGHPISGAFQFRILGSAQLSNLSELRNQVTADPWRWPAVFLKFAHYLLLVYAAGAVLFAAATKVRPDLIGRSLTWAAIAAPAGIVLGLLLAGAQGAQLAGLSAGSLVTTEPWLAFFESTNVTSRTLAVLGLALVWVFLPALKRSEAAGIAATVGAALAAVSFAGSGHVVTADPRWLMMLLLASHTVIGTFWAGSILPLAEIVRRASPSDARRIAERFSDIAVWTVGLLLAAGLAMTWVQMDGLSDVSAAVATPYAQRLAIKILLVAAVVAIAVYNKFVLTPRLEDANARQGLQRLLSADIGLFVGILFATTTLALDAPPRNLLMQERMAQGVGHGAHTGAGHSAAVEFEIEAQEHRLTVGLIPNAAGTHDARLTVIDPSGKTLAPLEATLQLSNTDKGVAPLTWKAAPAADGSLKASGVKLPFAGDWDVNVAVLADAFTRLSFAKRQKIDPAGLEDMSIDSAGVVINWNTKNLPKDCPVISQDVAITVKVGTRYAQPGYAFGFDRPEWRVPPCSRVAVTLVNEDQVRHQFMVHGLPKYIYGAGMFHLEAMGGASRTGVFIVPSGDQTLIAHCDMPQHTEKGLKAQIRIGRGKGDLPSIPGLTAPRRTSSEAPALPAAWLLLFIAVALGGAATGYYWPRIVGRLKSEAK